MAEVGAAQPRSGAKKAKKHKIKRIPVRIDMTPMVDVAFLLLTFFMFTTTLTQPQVMEITMPPNTASVKVPESDLFSLLVRKDGAIFWGIGKEAPQKIDFGKLRPLLVEKNKENPKLITSLRLDRKASYQRLIDMLDELDLAEGELLLTMGPGATHERRFSLSTMSDDDLKAVSAL